ncbi:hypothetical protein D9M69_698070 [compost metagenome]
MWNGEIGRIEATAIELECRVRILRHGFGGDAADFQQVSPPDDRARAAEKCCVPQVVAVLHQAVEQLTFIGYRAKGIEVFFERIG